jgi:spoIIIJ-associated protein
MLETKVSEILENILGLLALEGSFEVEEKEDQVAVSIDTDDAGRLIGRGGETLSALQLLVNQMLSRQLSAGQTEQSSEFKRVIIDVANWRSDKEQDLADKAMQYAEQVKESGQPLELEPMPSWQRRIIHMTLQEIEGITSESEGEGLDRHLVIKPGNAESTPAES